MENYFPSPARFLVRHPGSSFKHLLKMSAAKVAEHLMFWSTVFGEFKPKIPLPCQLQALSSCSKSHSAGVGVGLALKRGMRNLPDIWLILHCLLGVLGRLCMCCLSFTSSFPQIIKLPIFILLVKSY